MIELRAITEDNFSDCLALKASAEHPDFVDSVVYSLAEAWVYYCDTKPFAIYESNRLVGFVSMYIGEQSHQIINFLIDDAFQHRGYETAAARACINFLQQEWQAKVISLPVKMENRAAWEFWQKIGFQFSDTVENGYKWMRMRLAPSQLEVQKAFKVHAYWEATLQQNPALMKSFFDETAVIRWHNTNEQFSAEEFIWVNCTYPNKWDGEIERIHQADDLIITVVRVFATHKPLSFHVTSFIKLQNEKIISIDEYWGDDAEIPQWRKDMKIGKEIK